MTLDLKGDYKDAYKAFLDSKAASQEIAKQAPFDKSYYLDRVSKNKAWFNLDRVAMFPSVDMSNKVENKNPPVFFVGFPRSGTTLVEQILSSNPSIETTGEEPLLTDLIQFAKNEMKLTKEYPGFLAEDLSPESLGMLRNEYINNLKGLFDNVADSTTYVDKLPLNLIEMGLINRIFPSSKIIMAYRDPRDVCISCFAQAFKMNPAMIQFLTLKDTAVFYAKTMDLWMHYKSILNLDLFEYKYEDLVENTEDITRKMVNFFRQGMV